VKAAVPHIIAGGRGGAIIATSSCGGLEGIENMGHYVAAKHGVVGLVRTLAIELAQDWIRVNAVCPSLVKTDQTQNDSTYRLFRPELKNPKQEDAIVAFRTLPLLPIDWIDARDISNAVLFLASDEARYVTGICLPVDAGALQK
jgi:(+)-trans-carveol dehydrogenase